MAIKITKINTVIKLIGRKNGASLDKIQEATGWQPHSVRAALSRLRGQGHDVEHSTNAKGNAFYRLVKGV